MDNSLLKVENLGWNADGKSILNDINFSLYAGEFVGLVGPNGAGKSSLLRCIYRHLKPSYGCVYFQGRDIWQQSLRENAKKIAVILQESHVPFGLRVKDVVAMGMTPHQSLLSFNSDSNQRRISAALTQVDLSDQSNQIFSHLSGGEKQRAMVARAIVQQPQLLLMDEPTNHLDIHYQSEVLQLAKDLNITVFASIHDLNLAATFCDRLLVIDQGRLVAKGTPETVLTEDMISQTFKTCALVDRHPLYSSPRITYAYHKQGDTLGQNQKTSCDQDL